MLSGSIQSGLHKVWCSAGVILGPLLFIVFIDDLPRVTVAHKCLYADDTSLFVREKSTSEAERSIYEAIDRAKHWFVANRLLLNEDKTQVFTFSHHHLLNNSIPSVSFLGFVVDEHLNWGKHIVSLKISQNNYAVRNLLRWRICRWRESTYFALVHCHLSYGTLLWGVSVDAGRVFILQKRVVRLLAEEKNKNCIVRTRIF